MKEEEAIGFLFSPLTFPDLPSPPACGVCERKKYGNSVYAMYLYMMWWENEGRSPQTINIHLLIRSIHRGEREKISPPACIVIKYEGKERRIFFPEKDNISGHLFSHIDILIL